MISVQVDTEQLQKLIECAVRKVLNEQRTLLNPIPASSDKPMTVDEAAEFLTLAKQTVYVLASRRQIPFKKKGSRLYFYKEELLAWLAEGHQKTAKETHEQALLYLTKSARKKQA